MIEELLQAWADGDLTSSELLEEIEEYVDETRNDAFSEGYHRGYSDASVRD